MVSEEELLFLVKKTFSDCFYNRYRTKLVGGSEEPFYKAPKEGVQGEIHFRSDFLRSALHETSHWCIAGNDRLKQDDWGYWYAPDGRNEEEQALFFKVEVKPQAVEKEFCCVLGIPFDVSVDNLDGAKGPVEAFKLEVELKNLSYKKNGFPKRAEEFVLALKMALSAKG